MSGAVCRYHSLCHLHQMFGEFERHRSLVKRPHVVQLAIFFHESVRQTDRQTSERHCLRPIINTRFFSTPDLVCVSLLSLRAA